MEGQCAKEKLTLALERLLINRHRSASHEFARTPREDYVVIGCLTTLIRNGFCKRIVSRKALL